MAIKITAEPFKRLEYQTEFVVLKKPKFSAKFLKCPHCGGTAHEEPDGLIVVLTCINCGYNKPIGVALCTQTV